MFDPPLLFLGPGLTLNSVVLELGIYLSHIIWRIRYRKLRHEAESTGKSIDELLDERNSGAEGPRDLEAGVAETENREESERRSASTSDLEPPDTGKKC